MGRPIRRPPAAAFREWFIAWCRLRLWATTANAAHRATAATADWRSSVMWRVETSLIWLMHAFPRYTVDSSTMTTTANMVDGPMPRPSCTQLCAPTKMVPSLTAPRPLVLALRMLVGEWIDPRVLPQGWSAARTSENRILPLCVFNTAGACFMLCQCCALAAGNSLAIACAWAWANRRFTVCCAQCPVSLRCRCVVPCDSCSQAASCCGNLGSLPS